jgi:DNA-directed RNA polymerase specialized sigma24 family protein
MQFILALAKRELLMTRCFPASNTPTGELWGRLYPLLRPAVKRWVYSAHISSSWLRQEEDIVTEIVQEAICRTFERMRKAEFRRADPVKSPEYFSKTIAHNYFIDLTRKDSRVIRLTQLGPPSREAGAEIELADVSEEIHEEVFLESLFDHLAAEVANFPKKQSQALLSDLARRMHFEKGRLTPLQRAFFKAGIRLQDYICARPGSVGERGRYAALLSVAYKRVSRLESIKSYIATA